MTCLSQKSMSQQAPAHSDAPVNAPDRQLYSCLRQSFSPRQHVLVDAVYQSSVQIEQKGLRASCFLFRYLMLGHLCTRKINAGAFLNWKMVWVVKIDGAVSRPLRISH
jgi:hypothetical protein